jgi:NAD+ synthase (glutamine-hydrolysing)
MPTDVPINVAVVQMDIAPGRPDINSRKILGEIQAAVTNGDDIIVFPEMAIPGYLLGDEWENISFVKDAYAYNEEIREATKGIVAIWGNVDVDFEKINEDGRVRKYNAAFIASDGAWLGKGKTHKTLLPNYREFDDSRYFYSLRKESIDIQVPVDALLQPFTATIKGREVNLGLILCEDMWSDDYAVDPIRILLSNGADVIINISSSPWTWRKNDKRHRVVKGRMKENSVPLIYANNVGIQNNGKNIYLFDGNSTIYNSHGNPISIAKDYCEETIRVTIDKSVQHPAINVPALSKERDVEELYHGLIFGIKKFFQTLNNPPVVIGASGGIDSSLNTALLALALGPENVFAINLPTQYNSQITRNAARQMAENMKIHYAIIPVQDSYEYTVNQLNGTVFERLDGTGKKVKVELSDLNIENIQARDRGSRVLAGIASALGGVMVNNGNKTEIAIGYSTLYGDVNGAVSLLGDLYKMEVYQLAMHINKIQGWMLIPQEALDVTASAELSEAQNVDEGKGDPILYPYHDKLLKAFIEYRLDPEDILGLYIEDKLANALGIEKEILAGYFPNHLAFIEDLEHKWQLFKLSIFKRIQAPPIITVSKRAFGFDLREAQNGVHFTRKYLEMRQGLI